jgi:hypothetical protein
MHQASVEVKEWAARTPSVEAVRPPRCLGCGAPSRPVGGALILHGHGLRDRVLVGPPLWEDASVEVVIKARRYRCQVECCGAVILVVPRGVLGRRRYCASAIGLALALWGLAELTMPKVRARVSPAVVIGAAALVRWVTLERWADAASTNGLFPKIAPVVPGKTRRATAARVATAVIGRAPPGDHHASLEVRAWLGGGHAA